MSVLSALVRKDLRVYRPVTVSLALATVCPYAMAAAGYFWHAAHTPVERLSREQIWTVFAVPAAMFGMMVVALIAATLGGGAFALERRERSAEFLAMLPVSRWRIALAKLIAAVPCLLAAAIVHGLVISVTRDRTYYFSLLYTVAMTFAMFSVGWFFSAFIESATLAACSAIGIVFMLDCIAFGFMWHFTVDPQSSKSLYFPSALSGAAGLLALIAGTVHYLRRIEP